jgi:hypothetical protein
MKDCQSLLIVDLDNGLTFRHQINVNNTSDIEKTTITALKFDLALLCFFF